MTTTERPPKKGERTRERILDTALEAFAEEGFNALSLRDIAARAGITHVGLRHHFASKEDLLLQVLERRDELDIADLLVDGSMPAGRDLIVWALRITARNKTTPGTTSLYARLSSEAGDASHPAHSHYVERYQRLAGAVTNAMAVEFEAHPPRYPITPEMAARQFIALMDGLQIQWLMQPHDVDVIDSLLRFLAGVGIEIERSVVDPARPRQQLPAEAAE